MTATLTRPADLDELDDVETLNRPARRGLQIRVGDDWIAASRMDASDLATALEGMTSVECGEAWSAVVRLRARHTNGVLGGAE